MNLISRTTSGASLIIIGLILIVISPFIQFVSLIYGIPLLILGIIIFFNKDEDQIEKRKDMKGGRK